MENPYSVSGIDPHSRVGGSVSPGILQALAATKPWVRFCSIIGFILTGLIVLGALGMLVAGGSILAAGGSEMMSFAGMPAIASILYLAFAFLYFFPSLKLWKYGTHIASLMSSNSAADLELALDAQRSFWKFVGILLAVFIGLYALILILVVVLALFGAASTQSFSP